MGQGLEVCLKARSRTVLAGVRPGSGRGQSGVRPRSGPTTLQVLESAHLGWALGR